MVAVPWGGDGAAVGVVQIGADDRGAAGVVVLGSAGL